MNQYTKRNTTNATYDINGNLTTGVDGSTYSYDAQNRLISATKAGVTETFKYDALNRMVSRTTNGVPTYNIWDGWNLILTYDSSNNWKHAYLNGPGGMLLDFNATTGFFAYHYGDASGSTTHIADSTTGALVEWYRYDLQGTPVVYDANNNLRTGGSAYDTRHLFTGQQWDKDLGLYDLRNRFYSPDIGRFLQADPSGFDGDATNLYRYCGNNPVSYADPSGLGTGTYGVVQRIVIDGSGIQTASEVGYHPGGNFGGLSAFEFGGIGFADGHSGERGGGRDSKGTNGKAPKVITLVATIKGQPSTQSGVKVLQIIFVDPNGQITVSTIIGTTNYGLANIQGLGNTSATAYGTYPSYTIVIAGSAQTLAFTALDAAALVGRLSGITPFATPPNLQIRYSFNLNVNFATNNVSLTGFHSGYPSFDVFNGFAFSGQSIYSFHEGSLLGLRPGNGISVAPTNPEIPDGPR